MSTTAPQTHMLAGATRTVDVKLSFGDNPNRPYVLSIDGIGLDRRSTWQGLLQTVRYYVNSGISPQRMTVHKTS